MAGRFLMTEWLYALVVSVVTVWALVRLMLLREPR